MVAFFNPCLCSARRSRSLAAQPPESQQLYKGQAVLEDAKKLIDLKVENDDVLALCYLQSGELT